MIVNFVLVDMEGRIWDVALVLKEVWDLTQIDFLGKKERVSCLPILFELFTLRL